MRSEKSKGVDWPLTDVLFYSYGLNSIMVMNIINPTALILYTELVVFFGLELTCSLSCATRFLHFFLIQRGKVR